MCVLLFYKILSNFVGFPEKEIEDEDDPIKKKRKSADPKKWKKNVRKIQRAAGKEYMNTSGTVMPSKYFRDYSCNCKMKCQNKITAQEKQSFFN